jgi:ribosome-associated protein
MQKILQREGKSSTVKEKDREAFELLSSSIIEAIFEKKGEEVVSLNLEHIEEAVADQFIICQASNPILLNAIANHIIDHVREEAEVKPYHVERGPQWTLIDYVDIVVHLFQEEYRHFYNIESLWADAIITPHKETI